MSDVQHLVDFLAAEKATYLSNDALAAAVAVCCSLVNALQFIIDFTSLQLMLPLDGLDEAVLHSISGVIMITVQGRVRHCSFTSATFKSDTGHNMFKCCTIRH